ncbi:Uu.00g135590.m01.CDS01 [Anthostomella pinea]|uniref:Uu.00g135590.m01.CDS01 n=1 Tax=Anthostomella pinea TaxID=933095 RepID=A0AAI8VPW8_9PEZI|nr:Uu.00g135590.m01.CDS01 [Anthostomella pinea]
MANPENSRATEPTSFAIETRPDNGKCAVAVRPIAVGSIILEERSTLSVKLAPNNALDGSTLLEIVQKYIELSLDVRREIATLHAFLRPDHGQALRDLHSIGFTGKQIAFTTKLLAIVFTNAFNKRNMTTLHLQASRFNHSCLPNVDLSKLADNTADELDLMALRDIEPGE